MRVENRMQLLQPWSPRKCRVCAAAEGVPSLWLDDQPGLDGAVLLPPFLAHALAGEASMVQMKSALGGIPVERAIITDFRTLSPDDPLQKAGEQVLAGFQHDFPVLQDGRLVGVLTRSGLLTALAQKGEGSAVRHTMETTFETADPGEMLESVFVRLQNCGCHSLPVLHAGRLAGPLTMENIGEFMMIQSALRGAVPPRLLQHA
jgi:CBS-domain-containing membrane protein